MNFTILSVFVNPFKAKYLYQTLPTINVNYSIRCIKFAFIYTYISVLIKNIWTNYICKQCWPWPEGSFRSALIWFYTVCKYQNSCNERIVMKIGIPFLLDFCLWSLKWYNLSNISIMLQGSSNVSINKSFTTYFITPSQMWRSYNSLSPSHHYIPLRLLL